MLPVIRGVAPRSILQWMTVLEVKALTALTALTAPTRLLPLLLVGKVNPLPASPRSLCEDKTAALRFLLPRHKPD